MAALNEKDLEKILEQLLEHVLKKTKQISAEDKKTLITQLVSHIQNAGQIHKEDLMPNGKLGKQLIEAIGVMMVAGLGKNNPDVTKQLQNALKNILGAINEHNPKNKLGSEKIEKMAEVLILRLQNKLDRPKKQEEKTSVQELIADKELAALLNNLYGVGPGPVLKIIGNLYAIPNFTPGSATAQNFMNEQNRIDSDRPDYAGTEAKVAQNIQSRGDLFDGLEEVAAKAVESLTASKEDATATNHKFKTPFDGMKRPSGPGSIGG